jgi:hypothetical protein
MNWSVSKFICTYHQSANWSVVSSSIHTPRRLNRSVSRFNLHCICIRELICSKFICIIISKPRTDLLVSSSSAIPASLDWSDRKSRVFRSDPDHGSTRPLDHHLTICLPLENLKDKRLSTWNKYQLLIIKHKKEKRERARERAHWSEKVTA